MSLHRDGEHATTQWDEHRKVWLSTIAADGCVYYAYSPRKSDALKEARRIRRDHPRPHHSTESAIRAGEQLGVPSTLVRELWDASSLAGYPLGLPESRSRAATIARALVAEYLYASALNPSLTEVARLVGRKDHSTILHLFSLLSRLRKRDGGEPAPFRDLYRTEQNA